jgi:glucose-6-phosphate 1-epimerase
MPDQPDSPAIHVDATPFGGVITLDGPHGRAVVHEHGAHVTSWTPAGGDEVLFVSRRARFDGRAAIRGGVPVIFPQFGPGPFPKHGFARTARWTPGGHGRDDDGGLRACLTLVDDAATRASWPHGFALQSTVRAGQALEITLRVENTGDAPFSFTGALHTYLRVGDVERVVVRGLEGRRFRDQLVRAEREEGDAPVRIVGPVDRVYLDVPGPITVTDGAMRRTLRLTSDGFPDVVLWNPWSDGARAFDDKGDDEWREMLCVEAAVVATPVTLRPGAHWPGMQRVDVERADVARAAAVSA